MSYQVIARKYRPQRFSDVVGQDHVTQTLANAIHKKRIAHAYLFVGPRGTGKTTIARIFAKCLNATDGPSTEFSDEDPRVREIREGRSLDVIEIDGASNRGIEEIRELRETVKYAPASSRFKVYIIDEVHMLTKEAFNALLKTLEEPPEHVKFMFATTEPEKVLPTILSRCQRFDLRRIPSALIIQHLGYIAGQEHVRVEEAALAAIARGSEGCMRDAESTLDQLISFCGEEIVENDVLSMFGLAARGQILGLAQAVLTGDSARALTDFNALCRQGKELPRLTGDLLLHFRNLLLWHISNGDPALVDAPEAEQTALREQAALAPASAVTRIMEVLTDCESRLRETASKKILVEVALIRAVESRAALSIDAVLQKLQELRADSSSDPGTPPAPLKARSASPAAAPARAPAPAQAPGPVPDPVQSPTPAPARTPATPSAPAASRSESASAVATGAPELPGVPTPRVVSETPDLESLWGEVLERVGRASPFARTYLLEAHPVRFEKGVFTIGFDPSFADHLGLVDNPKNCALIQMKLEESGHPAAQVKFVQAEAPTVRRHAPAPAASPEAAPARTQPSHPEPPGTGKPAPARDSSAPLTKEDFINDPLIRQALEVFKGQIIEVRA